jgi:predicted ATP-dependent endonuclease of OLD family
MFIKEIEIKNFRLFSNERDFKINDLNTPDNQNEGSGLTLFVGENGCGKTSLLNAFALPLLSYKSESFSLHDFYDPNEKTNIKIISANIFDFDGTMPKAKYKGKGFSFEAGVRSRTTKSYLSTVIVTDQKYIRADGEMKPKDGMPDLRVSVNNPWKGSRFNENDVLFLDKNRTNQARSGTFNKTRFDRLMEDFDFQYIKNSSDINDLNKDIKIIMDGIDNDFLKNAVVKFKEISKEEVSLAHINNWNPHNKAFLGIQKENKQHIPLNMIGSGYEMIFSLLYSFYLSQQSNKQLIVLIDEPELHLHPKLQEDFVKIILEFSKTAQIILTTHSPLFVKQALYNTKVKVNILKKEEMVVSISPISERVLPYMSANEINFVAFGLATEEYHNELFEELKTTHGMTLTIKDFDLHFFQGSKGERPDYPYNSSPNQVSIHTHLRTQIHHRGTSGKADIAEIKLSIKKMRGYLLI